MGTRRMSVQRHRENVLRIVPQDHFRYLSWAPESLRTIDSSARYAMTHLMLEQSHKKRTFAVQCCTLRKLFFRYPAAYFQPREYSHAIQRELVTASARLVMRNHLAADR